MDKKQALGIRIRKRHAEAIRKILVENNLLCGDFKIIKNKNFIYFPVKKIPNETNNIKIETVKREFEKKEKTVNSYKDLLSLPKELEAELPTSYDVIGDIILLKLPKNLLKYKKEIGESLLQANKNINVVCLVEPVTGELRTRNVEILAGEERTTTAHTEYGVKFDIDIRKTYFSPRLATERKHVSTLVKPNEIVVDMFSGIAPFSIMIAKYANPKIIFAVDKNKDAVAYARENIRKNKLLDKIEVIHTDAKNIPKILSKRNIKADRIIMNLPFSAHLFFSNALSIAADECIIHYYDILKEDNIQERLDKLKSIAKGNNWTLSQIDVRKIKTYAPREFYIGIDIRATKMPM